MTFLLADLPERMQNKITVENGCWVWAGAKNNRGYGSVTNGKGGTMLAHRKAFEIANGPIAAGLEIDHLCENRPCVNPAHLDAVTPEEHRRRMHDNLKVVYASDLWPTPKPDPVVTAVIEDFITKVRDGQRRYEAMTPTEQAADDARRHRLHVEARRICTLQAVA